MKTSLKRASLTFAGVAILRAIVQKIDFIPSAASLIYPGRYAGYADTYANDYSALNKLCAIWS